MINMNDDDDFTAPSPRSNLAILFTSPKFNREQNGSLVYNAPKQPPKQRNSSVLCAKIVNVVEGILDDSKVHGKYGIAVIGNETMKMYELLLYKTKDNIITRTKISPTFNFCVQDYIYGVFYTSKKNRWVISFHSQDDISEFCKTLKACGAGITKTNTDQPPNIPIPTNEGNMQILPNLDHGDDHTWENTRNKLQAKGEKSKTKSQLTNRMAKVGLPVLPKTSVLTSNEIDSDLEYATEVSSNPDEEIKDGKTFLGYPKVSRALSEISELNRESTANQYVQNVHYTHSQILAVSDPINILATETRLASCETKVNLNQIQSKLDILLNAIQNQNTSSSDIENLISKNKVLQLKVENLECELEKLQNEKQKLLENCEQNKEAKNHKDMLENENKTLRSKVLNYELEMINLKKEVELAREEKKNTFRLLEQNQTLLQDNVRLQNKLKDLEAKVEEFNKMKSTMINLNKKLLEKEEEVINLKKETDNISNKDNLREKAEVLKALESQIKDVMNMMYQTIVSDNSIHSQMTDEFKPLLVKHVKSSTFRIIDELHKNLG